MDRVWLAKMELVDATLRFMKKGHKIVVANLPLYEWKCIFVVSGYCQSSAWMRFQVMVPYRHNPHLFLIGCRPPSVNRKCVDNGTTLMERRSKYILTTDGITPVCTERQIERPILACSLKGGSKTWKVRDPCDPSTCQRMVHTYKRTSQGCKCLTKKYVRLTKCVFGKASANRPIFKWMNIIATYVPLYIFKYKHSTHL